MTTKPKKPSFSNTRTNATFQIDLLFRTAWATAIAGLLQAYRA